MRRVSSHTALATALWLCLATLCAACTEEDPKVSKEAFPEEMAAATCGWTFSCCDAAERQDTPGGAQDRATCEEILRTTYTTLFFAADPERWSGSAAHALVSDVRDAAESCPRAYDPSVELATHTLVASTQGPGDLCENTWDCSTKFCKSGVCANPLPKESPCTAAEPCESGLRCIEGSCRELQPDGAQCATGHECISGACGGGKCVVSVTFTCDGA